jgi:phosphotransferase system enzyme I (PtsI)
MGLRQFSMHPSHILSIKQQVLHSQLSDLVGQSKRVLSLTDSEKIELVVSKFNHTV